MKINDQGESFYLHIGSLGNLFAVDEDGSASRLPIRMPRFFISDLNIFAY